MSHNILDNDWQALMRELPTGWRESARQTGAICQAGALADPEVLLRLLLGRAAGDKSLRSAVAHARGTGLCDVSDVALHKKEKRCADWLESIADGMLADTLAGLPQGEMRLRLIDATCASRPGSTGSDFRLHVNVELPERRFTDVELTDGHGGESLQRFVARPGDVFVADRAYGTADEIASACRGGADVLVRINASSLPLWSCTDGSRLNPLAVARSLEPEQTAAVAVEVRPTKGAHVVGRLCIYALPLEQALKAQARVRRTKLKHNKRPGAQAIESAKYVMLFTTVPVTQMTAAQACATYRLRWQIELAFKTLKTVLNFDELPNRLPQTGRTWLLAKLVCALLLDRLSARHSLSAFPPEGLAA